MSENAAPKTQLIAKLVATIVVAGMLLAGLLLPWVGGTGLVARNSASLLDALPVELTDATPAGNSRVLAADGSLITNLYAHNRTVVTGDKIAPIMKQALVDIEDSRFYEHNGLDVQGTMRALVRNVAAGQVTEGGSTLTQQLVKQTLLETANSSEERTAAVEQQGVAGISRKLREARLALALERTYSKDEILTRYLNIVYFGKGAYGIEAAAQKYFSTSAAKLTLPQAAMLAGLVQSPTNDDPITAPERAVTRRNQVLQRMNSLGHISDKDLATISAQPVAVAQGQDPPNGCIDAALGAFFCDYLYSYLTGTLKLTADQIKNGGWTIKTTLKPSLQRSADQSVLAQSPMGAPLVAAFDAVEPKTGRVLAMSVNRRYGCTDQDCESVNLNVAASKGSGSTYKVFTAAAALSAGFGSGYTLNVPQPYYSKVYKNNGGPYIVKNDNANYASTYNMTTGLIASANTYFVGLEDALGSIDPVVDTAVAMGMRFDNPVTQTPAAQWKKEQRGSFTLGPDGTSPLDLANAYATIAASGTRCEPTPVTAILDRDGKPVTGADGKPVNTGSRCTPNAIKPGVANTLANMMLGVVNKGTGRRARIPGRDIAGKTGTTQENETAAFVGITPTLSVSVMLFDPKGDVKVGGVGGGTPAQIFHDALAPLLASQPNVPFPPPDPAVAAGTRGSGYVAPAPRPRPTPTPEQPTGQPPATGGPTDPGTGAPANGDPADPFGGGFPFGN